MSLWDCIKLVKRLIRQDRRRQRRELENVVYPFRALTEAMRTKDPLLYDRIALRPVGDAWRAWKEVYPEDFPEGGMSIPGAHCIMPRAG